MPHPILTEILASPSGARFVRADLHLHRYDVSSDVVDPQMVAREIAQKAKNLGIQIIAFTDHNRTDNLQIDVEAAAELGVLALPGVEISTAQGHLLAIFAPDAIANLNALLVDLKVKPVDTDHVATTSSLADAALRIRVRGGIAIAAHIDAGAGIEIAVPGNGAAKKAIIHCPSLDGLETHSAVNSNWYSASDPDPNRYQLIRERSNLPETKWFPEIARVRGSDSHRIDYVGRAPDGTPRLTRLKLDGLSFEGLRVAFRDPTARIRLEDEAGDFYPRLIGIACDGGLLDGLRIHFSPNLTSFIGGRGTGKSTLIETLRWLLAQDVSDFATQARAPDAATLFVEVEAGSIYRIERSKGGDPHVFDGDDNEVTDFAFEIEAYGQGRIAKIAESSVARRSELIAFFDQFVEGLGDLKRRRAMLHSELIANDQTLVQADAKTATYDAVSRDVRDAEAKLKAAESGKLREVVTLRTALETSRRLRESLAKRAGEVAPAIRSLIPRLLLAEFDDQAMRVSSAEGRAGLETFRAEVRLHLEQAAVAIEAGRDAFALLLEAWDKTDDPTKQRVAELTTKLEAEGLKADLAHLQTLLDRHARLSRIKGEMDVVRADREHSLRARTILVDRYRVTNEAITDARMSFAADATGSIRDVLGSGAVVVTVLPRRFPLEYFQLLVPVMQGSSVRQETLWRIATYVEPQLLKRLVLDRNPEELATQSLGGNPPMSHESATELVTRLGSNAGALYALEHVGQGDEVAIAYRPEGGASQPIHELSQGQRHTILLSIAFASGKRCPLIIDQPEDELDNAFVFDRVVRTLRTVKERRQVVVVSHNANVVVLGDAELICVMDRTGDDSAVAVRGSIDSAAVKSAALRILSGGEEAFRRRAEMYGLTI